MGRFSFHLNSVRQETSLRHEFVDYARLTRLANDVDPLEFQAAWAEELAKATACFDRHYEESSRIIIDAVFDGSDQEYGPDHPALASDTGEAVEILLKSKGRDFVLDLLRDFKVLLQIAGLNSEALLLALKKFDKRSAKAADAAGDPSKKTQMMREYLPKLYASTVYHATGARSLEGELAAVRDMLEEDEEKKGGEEKKDEPQDASRGGSISSEEVKGREYQWFMDMAKTLSDKELGSLVGHRGFHCEKDDSVARPMENSLASFEYCWGAGVHLAECDVGATKDEKIIMAHDEDFSRLALMSDEKSKTVVKDLTLQDIMRLPLKHGSRPPLLVDVLRSAMAIGDHAKLVIEVKPGNSEIVEPLMMLFQRHPALLSRVAVIMSFDLYVMQDIADRFAMQNTGFLGGGGGLEALTEGVSSVGLGRRTRATTSRRMRKTRARPMQSVSYGAIDAGPGGAAQPTLLLLTAHVDYKLDYVMTSVKNGFEGIRDKLPVGNGIDGVYLEYQPEMLEPEGREHMLKLAESYTVGVWMLKPRDPDALSLCRRLIDECGVSFVNTDFHRKFFTS